MDTPPKSATCHDLHAAVGSFLLIWSLLEQGLTRAIQDLEALQQSPPSSVHGGLADRLDRWLALIVQQPENRDRISLVKEISAQCLALRDIRNVIVHGLIAADARQTHSEPYISCVLGGYEKPDRGRAHYTLCELDAYSQATDACRRAFLNLDHFNFRLAKLPSIGRESEAA